MTSLFKQKGRAPAANGSPAGQLIGCVMRLAGISSPPSEPAAAAAAWGWREQLRSSGTMLCLCLYVPTFGESQVEFEYFESKGLPAELRPIFQLSLLIPSQEFSTYRQWKQVRMGVGALS